MGIPGESFFRGKSLKLWGFLEQGRAEDLQNVGQTAVDFQFSFDDRQEDLGADRDPDLGLQDVLAGAEIIFEAQVLLDPFEEQFDLSEGLVEPGYGRRRAREVVHQEDKPVAEFDDFVAALLLFAVVARAVIAVVINSTILRGRLLCVARMATKFLLNLGNLLTRPSSLHLVNPIPQFWLR